MYLIKHFLYELHYSVSSGITSISAKTILYIKILLRRITLLILTMITALISMRIQTCLCVHVSMYLLYMYVKISGMLIGK